VLRLLTLINGVLVCSGKYTIMGQVIDGMDVLDKLEKLPVGKLTHTHNFLSL
jgi:cyclophilin family peptidyl-prolyl cis-trans isomerase